MSLENKSVVLRTLMYGALSVALYVSLYIFEKDILALSRNGGWNFMVPMAIAFVFSIVHGNFTGKFWDMFGIKAKTTKK